MRLPRVRFTVRRTMAAVAIVAVAFGVVAERRSRFERIAACCRREQAAVSSYAISLGYNPSVVARSNWYVCRIRKYERAAFRPWLPVEPDPPRPPDALTGW